MRIYIYIESSFHAHVCRIEGTSTIGEKFWIEERLPKTKKRIIANWKLVIRVDTCRQSDARASTADLIRQMDGWRSALGGEVNREAISN